MNIRMDIFHPSSGTDGQYKSNKVIQTAAPIQHKKVKRGNTGNQTRGILASTQIRSQ